MDSSSHSLSELGSPLAVTTVNPSAMTAEETSSDFPGFMVVGADPVPAPLLLKPVVVSDAAFHRLQDSFSNLALGHHSGNHDDNETDQHDLPYVLPNDSADPFRRIHDGPTSSMGDFQEMTHIGVFSRGDGIEDGPVCGDANSSPTPSSPLHPADLDSPLTPMPECRKFHQQQRHQAIMVGGASGSRCLPRDVGVVAYSQECTEDVDGNRSYQLGKHWEKGDLIGRGRSGTCYVAVDRITTRKMVVKQMSNEHTSHDDVLSEVEVMQDIKHTNIVQFYGATRGNRYINIFMEWMQGGSLEDRLRKGVLGEDTICYYVRQLVLGLRYLHRKGVAHRDLKGGNILIDRAGKVLKIADFGAAAHVKDRHKFHRLAGTPPYMAPEVVRANEAQGYGLKCDVWSLGCVVVEMATTRPPWVQENRHNNRWEILYKIGRSVAPPPIPKFKREDLRDFTIKCLRLDPEERPTAEELASHKLMN